MATLVKHYEPEQVPKRLAGADQIAYPLPSKQLSGEVADHHYHLQGGGSPKSVIRDLHAPSGNSSYYYSCSSSTSSAERAASANLRQQAPPPVDRHYERNNRLKLATPRHHHYKESSALEQMLERSAATSMNSALDHSNGHFDISQNGPHSSKCDIHLGLVPSNKLSGQQSHAQQSLAQQQQTLDAMQSHTTSKPHESYVSKGHMSANEVDHIDDSKLSRYQGTPLNSLINTLMQQYQPSYVVEDGKTSRHPCLNDVLEDVRNGGNNSDSTKPKLITPKWDEDEKWMHTNLSSTHSTFNTSTHNVPLFKLSHNELTLPVMNVAQESFSLQPSYNKVHLSSFEFKPCHFQTNASMWDKEILKNEVEKLTDAVSCAQACLERIQPIPPPRNTPSTAMNPLLAQGVFRNRVNPTMAQSTLKHNAQVDPVMMTKGVLGSSHVPVMGTSNIELFWSPDKLHPPSNGNHLTASQASQKEIYRPSAAHNALITPLLKDTDMRGNFTKMGEQFHVQKPEKSGQRQASTTSYMKDACTEITPTTSHRDMGTQMTPVGSSRHSSRPHSPQRGTALSPARHNTPTRVPAPTSKGTIHMSRLSPMQVESCQRAQLEFQGLSVQDGVQQSLGKSSFDSYNWSSREEEEEDIGKGLRQIDLEDLKLDVIEARTSAWKEATRLKLLAKYEREETKIQAWEDLQAAKAEADLKKLEMKLEKKRLQTTAKIASRLDAAHKRAQERRAAAKADKQDALEKTSDRAHEEANLFRVSYPLCACFTHSFG